MYVKLEVGKEESVEEKGTAKMQVGRVWITALRVGMGKLCLYTHGRKFVWAQEYAPSAPGGMAQQSDYWL